MVGHCRGSLAKALTIALPVIPSKLLEPISRIYNEDDRTRSTSDNGSRHVDGLKYGGREKS